MTFSSSTNLSKRLVLNFFLGFSSGLPLLTLLDLLKAWMSDEKVDLATIGYSGIITLPYTLKFLWAPLVDSFSLPILGRRRGWMLFTQLLVGAGLLLMGTLRPAENLSLTLLCALFISVASATQDIVLDAFRRDTFEGKEFGIATSVFVTGYRVGMIVSSSGALILADHVGWFATYALMGCCMSVGVLATLFSSEPEAPLRSISLSEAVKGPLAQLFEHKAVFTILSFVLLYKLGDTLASSMTIPYYRELGFTKEQIGLAGKTVGITALLLGGMLGGSFLLRMTLEKGLLLFGFLQGIGILGFPLLLLTGPDIRVLCAVVGFENLCIGLSTAAFVTFLGNLCRKEFSATQYALFTSIAGIPRTLIGSLTGEMAKALGWGSFFIVCAGMALPGLLITWHLAKKPLEQDGL